MLAHALPLLAPLILLGAALFLHLTNPTRQKGAALAEGAAFAALVVAVLSLGLLVLRGAGDGFVTRLDAISITMLLLVAFIGWVVVRYSRTYLDGEARQGTFTIWLLGVLASVLLLVQAGNLVVLIGAWVATSLCLHKLLLFYPERVAARRAARKKFVTARLGDAALVLATLLLVMAYGSTQISTILAAAKLGEGGMAAVGAAALLALAAVLKSAQFPSHGWLTEVMEAPTPVSALLHAGVVNGGGFLLIRFADVMLLSPLVLAGLVLIGGFTALFGGLVMLTQPTVKSSLAWSTVAQMGFMIFQCGLALFPLALLHIVAHSLYKAHAFLSAGGAVERVTAISRPGPVAVPNLAAVTRAFALAIAIYGGVLIASGLIFGFADKSPQGIALGTILIFGVAYLLAQGLADAAPRALTLRTAQLSLIAAVSYVALQRLAEAATAGTLPPTPTAGPLEWALILLALLSFGLVALAQATLPLWSHHPAAQGLRIHLSNGLYINAIEDRLLHGWSLKFYAKGASK
ncbi:NAD(P)H-quinone oxidoreductase subunit 5 [Pseudorhodobacter antarcticus]|uniref:Probable inorganic carbon transporter subunit DabB n=1 Tax=Pseudorhodobacter antarcticus TaxID=1077947 RepID=A0A1H8GXB7_9RHOB|nr:NADH-quinone oxidoreductase subunit L [Pseudorhodobacter antarcticus]SEN48374.1 NAD(P)H-quinone oxidoreductase subunit 5 [Pseudorhodobacter antarcticus]